MRDSAYGITTRRGAQGYPRLAAHKADLVKIWVDDRNGTVEKLKPNLYRALIDEAHKHNMRVMAHITALDDVKDLVRSGIDGFAHMVRDKDVDVDRAPQGAAQRVLRGDAVGRAPRALYRQACLGRRSRPAAGVLGRGHQGTRRATVARPEGRSQGGLSAPEMARPTCAIRRSSTTPACGWASAPTPAGSPVDNFSASAPTSNWNCW
jgi:hypothetical protein